MLGIPKVVTVNVKTCRLITESGNEHIEIDVTTQNDFAHGIPLGVMMYTYRPITF